MGYKFRFRELFRFLFFSRHPLLLPPQPWSNDSAVLVHPAQCWRFSLQRGNRSLVCEGSRQYGAQSTPPKTQAAAIKTRLPCTFSKQSPRRSTRLFEEAPSPLPPVTSVHAPSMAVGDNRGAIRGAMAPERATFHRAVLFLHLAVVGLLRQWLVHPPAHQCVTVVDI